jgi:hypothetical protein
LSRGAWSHKLLAAGMLRAKSAQNWSGSCHKIGCTTISRVL